MIAHVSIGVGNADTSKRFYDARAGAALIQVPEDREIAIGLRAREYKRGPVYQDCPRRRNPVCNRSNV